MSLHHVSRGGVTVRPIKPGSRPAPAPTPAPAPAPAPAPTPVTWTGIPTLSVSGANFVTPDGQKVLLRGANFMRAEYVSSEGAVEKALIAQMVSDWHGNIVQRGFAADPVNAGTAVYLARLDGIVAQAKTSGCYVSFALRSGPENGAQYLGIPPQSGIDALAKLAARYKGETHVMYCGQVETNNGGGTIAQPTWLQIRDYTEAVVDAIRAAASPSVPIVMSSGTNYGRGINEAVNNPVRRGHVGYKTHAYQRQADNGLYFTQAVDAGLPVFVGEFAVEPAQPMTQADVDFLLSYMESKGLSWAAWLFDAGTAENMVTSNSAPFTPSSLGIPIRNKMLNTPPIPAPKP